MTVVALVDYGLGNLGSVANMLKRVGVESTRVSTPGDLMASERVLLPGVGAFDAGMSRLSALGLDDALRDFAASGRPLLGICLGMQLLLDGSAEGTAPGLSIVRGRSSRFPEREGLRVPHMGWNGVQPVRDDPLFEGLAPESRFYFVHSYCVETADAADVLATTEYGGVFTSMLRHGAVVGAQFHPEKSHAFGMTILRNFAA